MLKPLFVRLRARARATACGSRVVQKAGYIQTEIPTHTHTHTNAGARTHIHRHGHTHAHTHTPGGVDENGNEDTL